IYSPDDIESFCNGHKKIVINEFYYSGEKNTIDFKSKAADSYGRNFGELCKRIKSYFDMDYRVIVLTSTTQNMRNIVESLTEGGISLQTDKYPAKRTVCVSKGALPSFVFEEKKLILLNESGRVSAKKKKKRANSSDTAGISAFSDLKIGDYVVHENHGIGIFRGIEHVESDGFLKDYLCIEYGEGGKLYVSVNQMELVQKYIGGDTEKLKLDSLGGASWAKAKAKARTAVKALAFDIVELYGKRQVKKGYRYSPDTVWQAEFEEAFPFEETDGQLEAVEDIKKDMEDGKIMDRLICGDVGYGKTEVALRAAFKAICDSKQVAFLVPTTILSNQHYQNIKERFKDYPITIEVLSRFKSQSEQKKTVERLKSGECDFVVGTHRLLSKDIEFKNLGLVIVDEEQRFGVGHKEKLKRITEDVDVLTLSATPIPRTLHMSLSGIRDMSILNEPPQDRLPVQTYVMEYSEETVRTAILRELSQGGQVYYLHNRVQTIEETAEKVKALIPEARVGVSHGQMKEKQLESVLEDFLNKDIDVLVCTTIIETGMDIQNVNTIIIENADYMGLSQLYQLRGRVGRANKQAYCYLMYKKDKIPSEVSEKRLKTIKEFTEFGSGFKVALRDLEIRGAGDLLGANQHGHMDKIGYDMYCKILDKAIRELKGEKTEEPVDTLIDISVNAFIPDTYISDEIQKLEMYKKISYIINQKDFQEVSDELIDRFGDYPKVVENLMNIALMKEKARKLKITAVTGREHYVMFTFKQGADPDGEKILNLIREMRGRIQITASGDTYLTYKTETKGTELIGELTELIDKIS
ncbi:MAG: transcription-repair coupling factor, partial [Clostridiales bacterium]|nr:transcription-repair coupling factor [Clostridiales bacterium]